MQWRVKEVNVNVNSCSSFHIGNFMGFFFLITFWLQWVFILCMGILIALSRAAPQLRWASQCGDLSCCEAHFLWYTDFTNCGTEA